MQKTRDKIINDLEDCIRFLEMSLENFRNETSVDEIQAVLKNISDYMESESDNYEQYRKEFAECGVDYCTNIKLDATSGVRSCTSEKQPRESETLHRDYEDVC